MKITSRKIGVGLTMLIYNTYTREKEEFKPIEENKVKMYICGPTVYNYIHIGNARPVLFFDLVHRYFKYLGYEVEFVSNVTDVDDKIINRAIEEEVTEAEIAEKYLNYFLECNPRFSGGVEFSCMSGYDCVKNHINCFNNQEIDERRQYKSQYIARKYEEYVTGVMSKKECGK